MIAQDIIGQSKPYESLINDLEKDRLTHAYLFSGPTGVGKKLIAKVLYKKINGHDKDCDCSFCKQVENNNHPDLMIVEPEGKFIKIGQARKIQHFLSLMPIESKVKMAIIDDAHELKTEAANALLKTLEEPSENSLLVLVTSIPQRLILTIKSRCRQVRFNAIEPKEISGYLQNNYDLNIDEARLASNISGGLFGKAIKIAGDGQFWSDRKYLIDLAFNLPHLKADECFNEAQKIVDIAQKKAKAVEDENIDIKDLANRYLLEYLTIIQSIFRDMLVMIENNDEKMLINIDKSKEIKNILTGVDSFKLVGYIEKIEDAKEKLSKNTNALLVLQSLYLNIEAKSK